MVKFQINNGVIESVIEISKQAGLVIMDIYKTDFNGTSKGVVDFYDIITGGTTCFETINEIKTGTDQSVRTTLDGTFSEDMDWKVSEDRSTLYLTYPNGLEGSSETTGCALSCYCRAKFDRVD